MSYTEGDVITSRVEFRCRLSVTEDNPLGLVDPSAVHWVYKWEQEIEGRASGPATLTYGVDEEISRDSLGRYVLRFPTAGTGGGTLVAWWEPRGVGECSTRRRPYLVEPAPQPT